MAGPERGDHSDAGDKGAPKPPESQLAPIAPTPQGNAVLAASDAQKQRSPGMDQFPSSDGLLALMGVKPSGGDQAPPLAAKPGDAPGTPAAKLGDQVQPPAGKPGDASATAAGKPGDQVQPPAGKPGDTTTPTPGGADGLAALMGIKPPAGDHTSAPGAPKGTYGDVLSYLNHNPLEPAPAPPAAPEALPPGTSKVGDTTVTKDSAGDITSYSNNGFTLAKHDDNGKWYMHQDSGGKFVEVSPLDISFDSQTGTTQYDGQTLGVNDRDAALHPAGMFNFVAGADKTIIDQAQAGAQLFDKNAQLGPQGEDKKALEDAAKTPYGTAGAITTKVGEMAAVTVVSGGTADAIGVSSVATDMAANAVMGGVFTPTEEGHGSDLQQRITNAAVGIVTAPLGGASEAAGDAAAAIAPSVIDSVVQKTVQTGVDFGIDQTKEKLVSATTEPNEERKDPLPRPAFPLR